MPNHANRFLYHSEANRIILLLSFVKFIVKSASIGFNVDPSPLGDNEVMITPINMFQL